MNYFKKRADKIRFLKEVSEGRAKVREIIPLELLNFTKGLGKKGIYHCHQLRRDFTEKEFSYFTSHNRKYEIFVEQYD